MTLEVDVKSRNRPVTSLITGAVGFAGSHLAEHLAAEGDRAVGTTRGGERPWPGSAPAPELVELELLDEAAVLPVLREIQPQAIYHLAAQSNIHLSWKRPQETLGNNILAQTNLLEAVRAWRDEEGGDPTVVVVGSADEYGRVLPEELPIKETQPLRPYSPYAVSKIAQDYLGYQYHASYGLRVIRLRPFNHIGPRQDPSFVTAGLAKQLAEIELGLRPPALAIGNLEVERDFCDVADIVRGYRLAVLHGVPGEVYNLGSERATSVGRIVDILLGYTTKEVEVEQEPGRLRPVEVPRVVADCTKFRELTGWQADIALEESLKAILDYWRTQVAGGAAKRGARRAGSAPHDQTKERA